MRALETAGAAVDPALADRARSAAGDLAAAVALARELGSEVPPPGAGRTRERWSALATLGAVDLTVARVAEPHLDALAILRESGDPDLDHRTASTSWGVYAAEGAGARLSARPDPAAPGSWTLTGTKPWCSLAEHLDDALVTAWVDDERRGLFAVSLRQPAVSPDDTSWAAHGLPLVRSTPVTFSGAVAAPVGGPGWYLERDGFAWGGIGVAAVWCGGALGLAQRLRRQATGRGLDQVGRMHLGTVDAALHGAWTVLAAAADDIDAGRADGARGALLALRVRQVVADAVETTIRATDHALGPAPLALEPEHAARVSDLRLYVRQHHAERDAAALGAAVLDEAVEPW